MRSPRRVAVESTSGRFSERNDNCEVFRQALSECCLQSLWVCVNRRASRSRRRPSLETIRGGHVPSLDRLLQ
jgi:hypothetical protein